VIHPEAAASVAERLARAEVAQPRDAEVPERVAAALPAAPERVRPARLPRGEPVTLDPLAEVAELPGIERAELAELVDHAHRVEQAPDLAQARERVAVVVIEIDAGRKARVGLGRDRRQARVGHRAIEGIETGSSFHYLLRTRAAQA
jgi:hypothetical protein